MSCCVVSDLREFKLCFRFVLKLQCLDIVLSWERKFETKRLNQNFAARDKPCCSPLTGNATFNSKAWIRILNAWIRILKAWIRILKAWIRILKAWIRILKAWIHIFKVWIRILKAWIRRKNLYISYFCRLQRSYQRSRCGQGYIQSSSRHGRVSRIRQDVHTSESYVYRSDFFSWGKGAPCMCAQYREWTVGPLDWSLFLHPRRITHTYLPLSQPVNCIFWQMKFLIVVNRFALVQVKW